MADASLNEAYSGAFENAEQWNDRYAFTSPAGRYMPNSFGLYDMQGNVFEWCADWNSEAADSQSAAPDPTGPPTATERVLRGGSFFDDSSKCRPAYRTSAKPDLAFSSHGFRVVREVSPHPPAGQQDVGLEDFLGIWEGEWDNRFGVRVTVTTPEDPEQSDAGFVCEWEERVGQPFRRSDGSATIEAGKLISDSVAMTLNPLNSDRCTAVGHFFERRSASLKRQQTSSDDHSQNP